MMQMNPRKSFFFNFSFRNCSRKNLGIPSPQQLSKIYFFCISGVPSVC